MSVYNIIFSPTGGTKKAADLFAESFCLGNLYQKGKDINLMDRSQDFSVVSFLEEDICIIAVPSYGGRVPAVAVSRLSQMKGNGARAILMAVYGNRAYEDTLIELQDVLMDSGFSCIAAVAAIAEHSIMHQFAAGRPDGQDKEELAAFAETVRSEIEAGTLSGNLVLPGNRPYREYGVIPMKPQAGKACTHCGLCARECPVEAIDAADVSKTDTKRCISCMHCVAVCPQGGRQVSKALLAASSMKLKKACSGYKKNELFLPQCN